MEDENKNKYDFLNYLLGEGDAMVCLDARIPEVDVPKSHKNNSTLNLVFNLNFRRPLEINKEGIFATLAFSGRPHKCVIPFDAVWAIYDPETQKGQVWEEAIPKDINLAEQLLDEGGKIKGKSATVKPGRPPAEGSNPGPAQKDRGHLRVIK